MSRSVRHSVTSFCTVHDYLNISPSICHFQSALSMALCKTQFQVTLWNLLMLLPVLPQICIPGIIVYMGIWGYWGAVMGMIQIAYFAGSTICLQTFLI